MNARLLGLLACLLAFTWSVPALAWGDIGHRIICEIADEDRAAWRASGPIDWANESFAILVSLEVGYCVHTSAGCWYDVENERLTRGEPKRTVVIDRAYVAANAPTVRDRLVRAGIRLGGLLNQALGPSSARRCT